MVGISQKKRKNRTIKILQKKNYRKSFSTNLKKFNSIYCNKYSCSKKYEKATTWKLNILWISRSHLRQLFHNKKKFYISFWTSKFVQLFGNNLTVYFKKIEILWLWEIFLSAICVFTQNIFLTSFAFFFLPFAPNTRRM